MTHTPLPLSNVLASDATDKRIDILRRIAQVGSISQAAREAGVSYKAAWQALETLTNLAGTALVEKVVGGSGGGGAGLTPAGQRVLQAAEQLAHARQQVLTQLDTDMGTAQPGRAALALRTSMRNQFLCEVAQVRSVAGQVRVGLCLADGAQLHARITQESRELLGLCNGLQVLALCKATAVTVAHHIEVAPGRNVLNGHVVRVSRAAAGGEATVRLDSGVQWVGFVAASHRLKPGQRTQAAVDESAIVIARFE